MMSLPLCSLITGSSLLIFTILINQIHMETTCKSWIFICSCHLFQLHGLFCPNNGAYLQWSGTAWSNSVGWVVCFWTCRLYSHHRAVSHIGLTWWVHSQVRPSIC